MKDSGGHGSDGREAPMAPMAPEARMAPMKAEAKQAPMAPEAPEAAVAGALAQGHPKSAPVPVHGGATGRYNAAAVNNAIASSNRRGPKISGREATMIHRVLKGRG